MCKTYFPIQQPLSLAMLINNHKRVGQSAFGAVPREITCVGQSWAKAQPRLNIRVKVWAKNSRVITPRCVHRMGLQRVGKKG